MEEDSGFFCKPQGQSHSNKAMENCAHRFSQLAASAVRGKLPWNFWSIAFGNFCSENAPSMAHAKLWNLHHQAWSWEDQCTISQQVGLSRCRFCLNKKKSHPHEWIIIVSTRDLISCLRPYRENCWAWQGQPWHWMIWVRVTWSLYERERDCYKDLNQWEVKKDKKGEMSKELSFLIPVPSPVWTWTN